MKQPMIGQQEYNTKLRITDGLRLVLGAIFGIAFGGIVSIAYPLEH